MGFTRGGLGKLARALVVDAGATDCECLSHATALTRRRIFRTLVTQQFTKKSWHPNWQGQHEPVQTLRSEIDTRVEPPHDYVCYWHLAGSEAADECPLLGVKQTSRVIQSTVNHWR